MMRPLRCGSSSVVEHLLPKQRVASSNLVFRSNNRGDVAEWLGKGLQNLAQQFDSARHLHKDV